MLGRLIDGRYLVISRIARGGMATVYLATDQRLDRRVAVKIMHGHLSDDSQFKQRFIQEARSAARLAHPNVVNVFDQGQDADSAYLVMEYLPGMTLRDLLNDYGALTSEQTLDISKSVLSGLAAAHQAGILHRDLKPENVLLANDGRIKIADFGLARAATANTATGQVLLGTIAYLSPELVTRGVADMRSDIYAVGIMMYEMLTGEQPYKGEQPMAIAYQHANQQVPPPSARNPRVPAELDELVRWATARDPEDRPEDAGVLLEQLLDTESLLQTALPARGQSSAQRTLVLPSLPPSPPREQATEVINPPSQPRQSAPFDEAVSELRAGARRRRARGWIVALLVVLLAGGAGGIGWWFGSGPGGQATVPGSLVGVSVADARRAILAANLRVAADHDEVFSTKIASGLVVATNPAAGKIIAKGSLVRLILSKGPEAFSLDALAGKTEDEAKALVSAHWAVQPSVQEFSSSVPSGRVISAAGKDQNGQAVDLSGGSSSYFEQLPVTLTVSVGPIPSVVGKNEADATTALTAASLKVGPSTTASSSTVSQGSVISVKLPSGAVHPNDTVSLVVSSGPPPVVVPNVVGQNWQKAKHTLSALGFQLSYNNQTIADAFPTTFQVTSTSPAAGVSAQSGSTITVVLEFTG